MNLGIEEIRPNRSQPRRHFDERHIEELAESIRSKGHARALLAISDEGDLRKAAGKVIAENLSVRAVEALVQRLKSRRLPGKKRDAHGGAQVRHLIEKLQRRLGAKVGLRDKGGKGVLEIRYGSLQELDRVLAAILGE